MKRMLIGCARAEMGFRVELRPPPPAVVGALPLFSSSFLMKQIINVSSVFCWLLHLAVIHSYCLTTVLTGLLTGSSN